jgi:hypothetical protein
MNKTERYELFIKVCKKVADALYRVCEKIADEPCDTCVHYTKERVDRFEYCDRCKWNCNDHYEPIG